MRAALVEVVEALPDVRQFHTLAVHALQRRAQSFLRIVERIQENRRVFVEFGFHFVDHPPNHALQRTRPSRRGFMASLSWAGSLSLGR